jgi:integrase
MYKGGLVMASVKKRGNSWSVRYRAIDEKTGKEQNLRASGYKSEQEAWADVPRLEATTASGVDIHADTMTCGELLIKWMDDHCKMIPLAETTIAKYTEGMEAIAKTFVWDTQIRKMGNPQFRTLITLLRNQNPKRQISTRTVLDRTEPLRLSINWAVSERIIARNPLGALKLPKADKPPLTILNDYDISELAALVREKEFRIPFLLAAYGGLRREEAAALRWDTVDFKACTITIINAEPQTSKKKRIKKDTKTINSKRTISMPKKVMDVLKSVEKKSVYVCVTSTGAQYGLDSYAQAVGRLIDKANKTRVGTDIAPMPAANYHDLRHSHAAHLIKMGVQPKVIQERLGHASIKITMDTYGYLMTGIQAGVADDLDARITI